MRMHADSLLLKWKAMHYPKRRSCAAEPSIRPIGLRDVQGVFYIFAVSLSAALIINIGENVYFYHIKRFLTWVKERVATLMKSTT